MFRHLVFLLVAACYMAHPSLADTNPPEIETSKTFGSRTVYYNVFPSMDMQPAIAARYGITRANDQMVVNISVRDSKRTDALPLSAKVTGTYSDLMSNKSLAFREIRETSGISYIAQLRVSNRELLRFDISVQPAFDVGRGETPSPPLAVTFTRRFSIDD